MNKGQTWEGLEAWTVCWHTHPGLQEKRCILGKKREEQKKRESKRERERERWSGLSPFIALLLTSLSSPFPLSNSHHLFYSSFNQFHFSPSTSKCSSSGRVPMATAVARQRATLHHPFQKSDRWRARTPRQRVREEGGHEERMKKKKNEEEEEYMMAEAWKQSAAEKWRWCNPNKNTEGPITSPTIRASFGFLLWLKLSVRQHFHISRRMEGVTLLINLFCSRQFLWMIFQHYESL